MKTRYLTIFIIIVLVFLGVLNYLNHTTSLAFYTSDKKKNQDNNILSLTEQDSGILTIGEKEWLRKQESLIYAADQNAPPLRFVDDADNQYKGVVVDYVNSLSLELGIDIKLQPMVWEDALINLSEGSSDICDMFRSEERAKHYLFTKPIYNLRAIFAIRTNITNTDNVNTWTVATQRGDYVNEYLKSNYPDMKFNYAADVSEALDLLVAGQVDAIAGDEPVVLYQIGKKQLESEVSIIEKPLYDNEVVLAVPKTKPELIPILNKGIASLQSKDQIERIQQKWFGISTPLVQTPDYRNIINKVLIIGGVLILIVIGMSTWNYSLKKLVEVRTRELEKSQNDLQIMFDGMTEYMVIIDMNKRIVNINNAFLGLLGLSKEQVLNRQCEEIFKKFGDFYRSCILDKTLQTGENCEEEIFSKNEVYMIRTRPLIDTIGNLQNIIVVIQNTTSEKISKNQLLQSNKMVAVGQLAAGVAHEIRNPLGIIRTHSFIMKSLFKDKKAVRSLNYIDTAVDRASRIVDNLLGFSRITGDTKELVNLKRLISEVLELQYKNLMNRNIEYALDCDESLKCYTNIESLRHIFINLISNAIDAIGQNGTLTITAKFNETTIILCVEDTGHGIPEEEIEKIFNPFYTTKDPGSGTGLGLYIVYNEIKKLNGEINVISVPNEKTLFKIHLPVEMEGVSNGRIV